MKRLPNGIAVFALVVANPACATQPAKPVFDPDPTLHPPGGRIVFNRTCADEDPYRVKAYARMESHDGRARAVTAVLAGYRAIGGKAVYVDVRLQRPKLEAGPEWRNVDFTVRLVARSIRQVLDSREFDTYVDDMTGEESFRTDPPDAVDWITFVEPSEDNADSNRFYRFGPEMHFAARDLDVKRPQDEFDLALVLKNNTGGKTLELRGPAVRVPERIWVMEPPTPQALGLFKTLNPVQEGGLFDVLGRGWKYRECIKERRAAKAFLGPLHQSDIREQRLTVRHAGDQVPALPRRRTRSRSAFGSKSSRSRTGKAP